MKLPGHLIALSPGNLRAPAEFPGFLHGLTDALQAGLPAVLVREPQLSEGDLLRLANAVMEHCSGDSGVWVGVHDSLAVALQVKAHGVHLGYRSLTPAVVREQIGSRLALGFSAHSGDSPELCGAADYLFYGPVHSTPSKEGILEPVGCADLAAFVSQCSSPVFGLGGITPSRVKEVRDAGAGVAVLSGILGSVQPGQAVRAFLEADRARLEADRDRMDRELQ